MSSPFIKFKRLRWWNLPIPLYAREKGISDKHIRVGWVYNQPVYMIKNVYDGWLAYVDDQTEEHLNYLEVWSCGCCGAEIRNEKKKTIETYVKER